MSRIISFMHISLDGFVAGPKGEMNWIKLDQEIFDHVEKRINLSDRALYGRVTYNMMESYWPTAADKPNATKHDVEHSKWYSKAHKIVLSKTMEGTNLPNTTIIGNDLVEKINELRLEAGEDILLFGSPSATHALMKEGLIDGYWLFVNPVILGAGIPLFVDVMGKVELKLQSTRQFTSGVTELNYYVHKEGAS